MARKKGPQSEELYLGKPVFAVTLEGEIRRTAVERLAVPQRPDPQRIKQLEDEFGKSDILPLMHRMSSTRSAYSVLDRSLEFSSFFFSLGEAITKAKAILRKRLESPDITKAQEKSIRKYLATLDTKAGRDAILAQPLVRKSEVSYLVKDRILKGGGRFPTEYFRPGERVYGIITPSTHHCVNPEWRPHPYFVLVTRVEEVSYSPSWPGKVYYKLADTRYSIPHPQLCGDEEGARQRMVAIFSEETGGAILPRRIKFIDVSEEKRAHDEMLRRIVASVRSQDRP